MCTHTCVYLCVIYICVRTHITVYFIQTIWEKNKEVLSHNHNNLWCNIVYNTFCRFRPDLSFVTCPNNVLYSILSFSARSHPVSRRAFPLEQFPSLSLLFMTWPFLKSSGQVFSRIGPQLGPAWCFLTDSGYTFSAAAPSTVCVLRASHPRARACLPQAVVGVWVPGQSLVRFLHCGVPALPLAANKRSVDGSRPNQYLLWWIQGEAFPVLSVLAYLRQHCCREEPPVSPPSVYLPIVHTVLWIPVLFCGSESFTVLLILMLQLVCIWTVGALWSCLFWPWH